MVKYGNLIKNWGVNNTTTIKEFKKEHIKLGDTITKIRNSKKMTQEDLADKAKINVSYLAKIENAYINTSVRYLIKIARGLQVPVKDLFEF